MVLFGSDEQYLEPQLPPPRAPSLLSPLPFALRSAKVGDTGLAITSFVDFIALFNTY